MNTINTKTDTCIIPLTQGLFHLGDVPDAWQAWVPDDDWTHVRIPHDWSVTLPFSKEYSSGTGYLAGGIGWYRLHIAPDDAWRGKRILIRFDGIYKNSRVWCNSTYLGERPNGYISFSYDITDCFRFDADNILCVCVDRRELSDSRWFTGCGITRKVTLTISEQIRPIPDGIFFHTPKVSAVEASYTVENELVNHTDSDVMVTLTNRLFSADGSIADQVSSQVYIPAGQAVSAANNGTLDNPLLWCPENPVLYTLETAISDGQSSYVVHRTNVGIRSIAFDADKGFFLNEKPYLLKGVCVHHDAGCLGAAVPPAVWHRRLTKLKRMGCNAIRMSHNPHMPELYALCDRLGFFVMDEAFDEWEGPKNKWWQGHNVYPPRNQGYYVHFPVWHERDLKDMIRRDRNHPSVILWSIGNEIDYPNDPYCHPSFAAMTGNNDADKPESERLYNPGRPNAERLAALSRRLYTLAKEADTTHPVTLAAAFPELSAKIGFIDPLDVVGFNYKEHLYAEHHQRFPDKPFLGSENGHSLQAWRAVTDNDYISGQFLWTGIDYLGEAHGWPVHGSGAGLLTLAGFEKSGYYRRQSFWSDQPVIHLLTLRESESRTSAWGETFDDAISCEFAPASECWNYCSGERVVVKCYTNLDSVEILLNERSLGIFHKDPDKDCILLTTDFEAGVLRAQAVAEPETKEAAENRPMVSHTLYTTGCACQMQIAEYDCDMTNIDSSPQKLHQLEITLLDSNGRRVYSDASLLHVTVENGTLLGIENGDLSDVTEYASNSRRAYHGQLMLYVLSDMPEAETVVQVRGELLASCTVHLH
ncbi:MAG: DUF4982 domain-containing protein [Roseburia sp.]|nr:DUF4982 domain-containing protein [Roseburia sp.]